MKILHVFLTAVLLCCMMCLPAAAQTYSDEYPALYNSGSPVWLSCTISGYGDFCIVLPPSTDLQSFGFDAPTGYNLINNTAGYINGKAYKLDSDESYLCRWGSFDCLYLRLSEDYSTSYSYTPVTITAIEGTTLDLIDYTGDRGNDAFKYELQDPDHVLVIAVVVLIFILVYQFHFKSRLMRL